MGCPPKQAFYFSKRPPSAGVKNKLGDMPYNSERVFYVLYPRVSFHIDKMNFFHTMNSFYISEIIIFFIIYYNIVI
jgi:hypothetical protein